MALSSLRATELVGRVAEKPPAHPVHKPTSGFLQGLPLLAVGVQPEASGHSSRDSSPDSRSISQLRVGPTSSEQSDELLAAFDGLSSRFPSTCDVQPSPATPAPAVTLDVCPSFAEQRPERTKPVFLERHGTLQHVYHSNSQHSATDHKADTDIASSPSNAATPKRQNSLGAFLPGWDIAKSQLWLLVESALERADALRHAPANVSVSPASAQAYANVVTPHGASGDGTPAHSSPAQPQAASPSAPPPPSSAARPVTPFARVHVQAALATSTPQPPVQPPPQQQAEPQARPEPPAQPASPMAPPRLLQHTASFGRPCASMPRGMGPQALPLPWLPLARCASLGSHGPARASAPRLSHLGPSEHNSIKPGDNGADDEDGVLQLRRTGASEGGALLRTGLRSHLAVVPAGGVPAAGGAAGGAIEASSPSPTQEAQSHRQEQRGQELQQPHGQPHVAFAAGLAAGTSTAAALTHAGAAAAAGLAAVAASVQTSSVALQLGANALNAGTDMLLSRYQGALIKTATSAVADKVLGPTASPSLRLAMRKRLRATVAGASVLWFLINTSTMGDTLMHIGMEHDFVSSAKMVLHFASAGPGFMENCRELLQIGAAVGLGLAERGKQEMAGVVACSGEAAVSDGAHVAV